LSESRDVQAGLACGRREIVGKIHVQASHTHTIHMLYTYCALPEKTLLGMPAVEKIATNPWRRRTGANLSFIRADQLSIQPGRQWC
jgi:hypothetical protein